MSTAAASPARVSVVNFMVSAPFFWDARESQRRGVGFAGADANGAVETEDEDLAVADLAGLGGRGDGFDGLVELVGRDRYLDLDLGQEAHGVFGAAVDFGVALLTPVSLDLGDGHPVHPDRGQSVADLIELERLDNGRNDFHGFQSPLGPGPAGWQVQAIVTGRCCKDSSSRGNAWGTESNRVPILQAPHKALKEKR